MTPCNLNHIIMWLTRPAILRAAQSVYNIVWTGGCSTNISRALQNNRANIYNASNHIYGENFKLKLCTFAQSHALGTRTKFQLEILIESAISAIQKFRENILESSRNVSETTPKIHGNTQCWVTCTKKWSFLFLKYTQGQMDVLLTFSLNKLLKKITEYCFVIP